MTTYRAPYEPYSTNFVATPTAIEGREVVLDETYFYAEGGGQPADRGTLGGIEVEHVEKYGGDVIHYLTEKPGFATGQEIVGVVDPAFRTYCMRAHTASHVLFGAGRRLLDDLGYGGFDISERKVRVDFATPSPIDDSTLTELERLVNRTVWDSRQVSWETHEKAVALEMDGIAFNTKTEEGLSEDSVRVVTVEGWDVAACGGTHVSNTREIGPVSVVDRSNPGEGLTRVEIAVGPPGIEHRITEKQAVLDAANKLGTNATDLLDTVVDLQRSVASLEEEVAELKHELAQSQIDRLRDTMVTRDGDDWLIGTITGVDADVLSERARSLMEDQADVVVLVGTNGQTFVAVASDSDARDAAEIAARVTEEFGGGGGGSEMIAQAGGIGAPADAVVEYLREN